MYMSALIYFVSAPKAFPGKKHMRKINLTQKKEIGVSYRNINVRRMSSSLRKIFGRTFKEMINNSNHHFLKNKKYCSAIRGGK